MPPLPPRHLFAILLGWLFLSALVFVSACTNARSVRKSPTLTVLTDESGFRIEQSGDTPSPAKVDESSSTMEMPVPPDSLVTVTSAQADTPAKVEIAVKTETKLTAKSSTVSVSGPSAFVPESAPSQNELARADGIRWSYVAGGVFLLAALALVYFQHYKAAGFAAVGACVVPIAGNLLSNDRVVLIAGILGAISITLFAAWYFLDGKVDGELTLNRGEKK